MGQYYSIALKNNDGIVNYNKRNVSGIEYISAKLLEHSYFGNYLVDSVANLLLRHKCRLAWVGDYAEQTELDKITNGEVNIERLFDTSAPLLANEKRQAFIHQKFNYLRKYLVNWETKEYISFDDYKKHYKFPRKTLVISPIPLITAIGNGGGGGDYYEDNVNFDKVGTWAWKEISIETKIPKGFKKVDIYFKESWIEKEENDIEKKNTKKKNK